MWGRRFMWGRPRRELALSEVEGSSRAQRGVLLVWSGHPRPLPLPLILIRNFDTPPCRRQLHPQSTDRTSSGSISNNTHSPASQLTVPRRKIFTGVSSGTLWLYFTPRSESPTSFKPSFPLTG